MAQASDYDSEPSLDLVLIGKTGSGKSATGNSILRREDIFTIGTGFYSETKLPKYDWSEFEGRIIQVVDSPGVIDTDEDEFGKKTLVHTALQNAMLANPKGYHAFLVVVKFSNRFTIEEQTAVNILKEILGDTFLRDYGIIVMSNGDTFKHHCEKDGLSLEKFCADQSGPFKQVLEECNKRIVVFDNQIQDEETQYKQVKQLIELVDRLGNGGKRYTNNLFKKADKIYQQAIATSILPTGDKAILKEMSLISHGINKGDTLHEKLDSLIRLIPRIKKLIKDLKDMDKEKGALEHLIKNVQETEKIIKDRIQIFHKKIALTEKIKDVERELSREEKVFTRKMTQKNGENLKLKETLVKKKSDLEKEKKKLEKEIFKIEEDNNIFIRKNEEKRVILSWDVIKNIFSTIGHIFKKMLNS